MLGHKEYFPTTGKNSDNVGIRIALGSSSHILFCTEKLIKAFLFGVLVNQDDLSAVLDHAMTRVAEKGKDSLMRIVLEEAAQFCSHVDAVFNPGFY